MKKLLCVGLFAAALALPARAQAWEYGPYKVNGGVKIYFNVQTGSGALPLAPWYMYFPAEARNLPVGPAGYYPNWRQPLPVAPGLPAPGANPPGTQPIPPPAPAPAPAVQQTGYYTISRQPSPVPAYWYGR